MKSTEASRFRDEVTIPEDKSVSHRSVMFGSIVKGATEVHNYLQGADYLPTIACFRKTGVKIENRGDVVLVRGNGMNSLEEPDGILDCGNSGTTTRLISGILTSQNFNVVLTDGEPIQKWPMKRVMESLAMMGAGIQSINNNDCAPLKINGQPSGGIHYTSAIPLAQVKSIILLAGLYVDEGTSVTEPYISRNHTELVLRYFGTGVETKDTAAVVRSAAELHGNMMEVPGDISSAVYFIAAGLMMSNSEILIKNVGVSPTHDDIPHVCQDMGADITFLSQSTASVEPTADLLTHHGALHGTEIDDAVIPTLIDELPMIATMTCLAEGDTVIQDATELKVKESNRLEVIVNCLAAVGASVKERPGGTVIRGGKPLHEAVIDSRLNHRITMTLAIAGLCADGETGILGTDCANISYPGFYEDLKRLI